MEVFVAPDQLTEKLEERRLRSRGPAAAVAYAVGRPPGGDRPVVRFAVSSSIATFDCDVMTPTGAILDVAETVRLLEATPPSGIDGELVIVEAPPPAVSPAPTL